jgi:hypothetical protein
MAPIIGLIVTGREALNDLYIFVRTIETWHPDAILYIFTDSESEKAIKKLPFKGTIHTKPALDRYTGMNRHDMSMRKGLTYDTLWKDFMYEKANVLEWMLQTHTHVWFLDADITFLAPLPVVPDEATLAMCPHYIRETDVQKFGKYNGGFLWMKDARFLPLWRKQGHTARFYEQSALEDVAVAAGDGLYEFPIQVNYGWWRMYMTHASPPTVQSLFTIFRNDPSVGIRYDGKPLQSIHTHWFQTETNETITNSFNRWIREFLKKFASHKPIGQLTRLIQTPFFS